MPLWLSQASTSPSVHWQNVTYFKHYYHKSGKVMPNNWKFKIDTQSSDLGSVTD